MGADGNDTVGDDPATELADDIDAVIDDELDAIAEADDAGAELDPGILLAERDEFRDTLLRVKAEFDNYRKRVARDEATLRERANENLVEKLLVVLDACDAAAGHGATDVEPISRMLLDVLEAEGLIRLSPLDEAFDPNQHEAVVHEPGDGGDTVVVETLRAGYQWKSRVLRPAMVKVRS